MIKAIMIIQKKNTHLYQKNGINRQKFRIILYFLVSFIYFNIITEKNEIIIDNRMNFYKEENIDFSNYSSSIKPIAIYNFNLIAKNETDTLICNERKSIIKNDIIKKLIKQIKLANSHGIYGFAFYYYLSSNSKVYNEPINIIMQNNYLKIKYLLILFKEETNIKININITHIFLGIYKYVIDERYIKFNNKIIILINQNLFDEIEIFSLRQKFKENNIADIFVLSISNNLNKSLERNISNGLYYSPSIDYLEKINFQYNKTYSYFYTHLIYRNLLEEVSNNNIFRTSIPLSKYPIYIYQMKTNIFADYSPEKFYFLNKVIIDWTKQKYEKQNQFILIDGYKELENDEILGYANINSFSKALYKLPFINEQDQKNSLFKLKKNVLVLVQAHIYYTDLIPEIINKTNNIPVPFDFYITTNTREKKNVIENYLNNNTKSNKYEILITQNKGRDIIPCLIQLKDVIMNYKYLCHIHSKKHKENDILGYNWQVYLFENLLGSKSIIQKILSDFENHDKLGFIYPEYYYQIIRFVYSYSHKDLEHVNHIFDILFPKKKLKTNDIIDFPAGNMFWAKTKAIYQMFDEKIIKLAPREKGQFDGTILHGIERFWIYLVKLNGFFYKKILYNI